MSPMPVLKVLMSGLFVYSAVLQLNDPDPVRWILFYAITAGTTLVTLFLRDLARLVFLALLLLGTAAIWTTLGVDRWHVDDEAAREAGGLLIAAGWLLVLWLVERRRAPATASITTKAADIAPSPREDER